MLSPHWGNILGVLDALLAQLKEAHVPAFLVRKLFQQLFSFVNVQLFNQLLLRRECCSFSNGEYVKTGLAEVENWIHSAGKDWVGESWDELRYIRQVTPLPSALPDSCRATCKAACTPAVNKHKIDRLVCMLSPNAQNVMTACLRTTARIGAVGSAQLWGWLDRFCLFGT